MEIAVNKVERKERRNECENGHLADSVFCPECGAPVFAVMTISREYPAHVVWDILPEEYEDVLAEITPPALFGTGVILAMDNTNKGAEWLYLSPEEPKHHTLDFPTTDEIEAMKTALVVNRADIIAKLRESPVVKSVTVKVGYVCNPEF